MCRRPILKPLSEINDLEPGRAEEDIVKFVKQYETCGLCDQKENPKLKCFECDCLICENCKPSHSKLTPSHNVNPLMQPASYNRPHTKQMCQQHANMSLDLFCFICQTFLCSYCEKFSHEECQVRCDDMEVIARYHFGFLQMYVKASELRTLHYSNGRLSRVVYLIDYVKEANLWLNNIKASLDECIYFFKEYQSNIADIIKDQFKAVPSRIQAIINDSSDSLKESETVYCDIVKLLEEATESEIAISVLNIEQEAVQIFMRRRKQRMEIRPLKFAFDKGVTFTQISTGYLHIPDGVFAGMLCIAYSKPHDKVYWEHLPLKRNNNYTEAESKMAEHMVEMNKSVPIYHDIISAYGATEKTVEPNVYEIFVTHYLTNESYLCKYTTSNSMFLSSNNMYTNECLDKTKSLMSLPEYRTIDIGFSDSIDARDPFFYMPPPYDVHFDDKENICIVMDLPSFSSNFKMVTSFANVFEVPLLFNVTGGYKQTYSDADKTPSLLCFIGNRNSVSGLETILLYFDKTTLHLYGVCINTSTAKFKNLSSIDLQKNQDFKYVKNKGNTFSFFSVKTENSFMASYRTKAKCTSAPKNLLVSFDPSKRSERIIPVIFETVSLFCSTTKGFYVAKHDDKLDVMTIEKMHFSLVGMEAEVIFSLKEADVGVPICKLKPLTLVENGDNDIVVVCAVENDRSNAFIMLWPYKEENDCVEVLEVQCPHTVLSNASVVDLEMDPDGNIVYVLENQEGQNQIICTKYFMPK